MVVVDREMVCQVFKLFDAGKTPYFIDSEGIAAERTAERLKKVHGGLRERKSIWEIARGTWSEKRIREIQRWWEEHQRANQPQELPQAQARLDPVMVDARLRHFARLTDIAQRLRDSVEEREGVYIEEIG